MLCLAVPRFHSPHPVSGSHHVQYMPAGLCHRHDVRWGRCRNALQAQCAEDVESLLALSWTIARGQQQSWRSVESCFVVSCMCHVRLCLFPLRLIQRFVLVFQCQILWKEYFLPDCQSGYRPHKDKVLLFSVPKDTKLECVECKDHIFSPKNMCIKNICKNAAWQSNGHPNAMANLLACTMQKAGLASDAVHTVYPNCPNTPRKIPKKKCSANRDVAVYLAKKKKRNPDVEHIIV